MSRSSSRGGGASGRGGPVQVPNPFAFGLPTDWKDITYLPEKSYGRRDEDDQAEEKEPEVVKRDEV